MTKEQLRTAVMSLVDYGDKPASEKRRILICLSGYAWRVGQYEDADFFDTEYSKLTKEP